MFFPTEQGALEPPGPKSPSHASEGVRAVTAQVLLCSVGWALTI